MSWDLNLVRGAVTAVSFLVFIALVVHTWNRKRQAEHQSAEALPFADE
ncbi:cbb3-type cytochrome oxidase subunit 3 [Inhella gelatinilytica]|uniref:CcoQ/FixQ family Cbb3-type cytochrome c oxidase assembly chaperone n=1 Tax=Inhella gelatinilytica TaxID=2795030 RepID=A0A931IZX7_9BURK|nr:CcoQ/FixQ family Cbb3-type cytochrome c oxidase assembly chaperone [Inhella gelatinilytica]MBH9554100.1 CcoQ/FixQ family Cbb3-type cytochrome c oxidase assembly chaperone [Inhella gelatinilytica]